jgi:lysophospholipase L1-like esterase
VKTKTLLTMKISRRIVRLHKTNIFKVIGIGLIVLGLLSCERNNNPFLPEDLPLKTIDSIKVLTLGDSYTIGTSVSENDRWPNQLRDSLQARGIPVKELQIIARNGWTTRDLLNAINNQDLKSDYDLVGLLIGVNNQFQGRSISEYENQFRQLLEIAITLADKNSNRVFTLSIPDYSVTPRGNRIGDSTTSQQIDIFNTINKKLSDQFSVNYFNITTISRTALDDLDLVASDDLHFSAKMYNLWIEYILDDLYNLLIFANPQ